MPAGVNELDPLGGSRGHGYHLAVPSDRPFDLHQCSLHLGCETFVSILICCQLPVPGSSSSDRGFLAGPACTLGPGQLLSLTASFKPGVEFMEFVEQPHELRKHGSPFPCDINCTPMPSRVRDSIKALNQLAGFKFDQKKQ